MGRVLFLAYHFPPSAGAAVQRSAKFVRYLPEFGYEPVVVTGPGAAATRWTPADPTLVDEIPRGVEVIRVTDPAPVELAGWRRRAARALRTRTPFASWWVGGALAAGRGVEGVDLIYASISPFETAEAAARLSRLLERPWIADLRDPWALDEVMVYPSRLHRRLEMRRMQQLLATAEAIVMNTDEASKALRRSFPDLAAKRIVTIPNGFDAADFAGPEPEPAEAFRIVHTGYLHTELGLRHRRSSRRRRLLGGAAAEVDFLTRSHLYLLKALEALFRRSLHPPALELHLAGVLSEIDERVIRAEFSHPERVVLHRYLPHGETVALMRSADLLFLPMHELPPGTRATIVPGKTYEYLAAGRPILAAVPDGDARDLLSKADTAALCRPSDVDAMVKILLECLDARRAASRVPAFLGRFERRGLTRRLAAVFSEVSGYAQATGVASHRVAVG